MTQLDKLEMLNSQWKAFAHCQSEHVKDYAKSVIMYMMTKGRITQLEKITANRHSITLGIQRNDLHLNIFIYDENDCDIVFHSDLTKPETYMLTGVNYFGLTEIIIEMFFAQGLENAN